MKLLANIYIVLFLDGLSLSAFHKLKKYLIWISIVFWAQNFILHNLDSFLFFCIFTRVDLFLLFSNLTIIKRYHSFDLDKIIIFSYCVQLSLKSITIFVLSLLSTAGSTVTSAFCCASRFNSYLKV